MAGKKFDLGAYNTDTRKTQSKHNKYTAFLENENASSDVIRLDNNASDNAPSESKVSQKNAFGAVQKNTAASSPKKSVTKNIPDPITEAHHSDDINSSAALPSKRINMAFSDSNYRIISEESERLSVSFVYFINSLIRIVDEKDIAKYINAMPIRRTKDNISRRKGKPAKRINLKFSPELHDSLSRGAASYNMTITQYMNTVIEVYAQDKLNISI